MESAEGVIPISTPPVYGGKSAGKFATSMKIDVLTKNGPDGTTADSSLTNSAFNILRKRHESRASSVRFYNHGHLLSKDLHGPGDNFKNLTPQSESGNQKFESNVERILKREVNKPEKGAIYKYKVEAIYQSRSDKGQLKQRLENDYNARKSLVQKSGAEETVKAQNLKQLDADLRAKKEIVDTEDYVATKFIVNAKPLNNKLQEIPGESFSNFDVPNDIKRDANKYVLPDELSEEERHKKLAGKKRKAQSTRPARAKKSRADINEVKKLLAQGKSGKEIANITGVSEATVSRIKKGQIT